MLPGTHSSFNSTSVTNRESVLLWLCILVFVLVNRLEILTSTVYIYDGWWQGNNDNCMALYGTIAGMVLSTKYRLELFFKTVQAAEMIFRE